MSPIRRVRNLAALALSVAFAACGGGGDAVAPNPPPPPPPGPAVVASVVVTPDSGDVPMGGTAQLSAAPKDVAGNSLSGRSISWQSSDVGVATVSPNGLVTTLGPGRVIVTATSDGKSGTAVVRSIAPFDSLPGAAQSPAVSAIPRKVAETRAEDYSTDYPDLPGLPVSFNTILVTLSATATIAEVNTLLREVQAQIVGGIPGVAGQLPGILGIRLPTRTHSELAASLALIGAKAYVLRSTPDVKLTTMVLPRSNTGNPFSWLWDVEHTGANWGVEAIRAPQAWNLNPTIRHSGNRTDTGIFDAGFSSHQDLAYGSLTSSASATSDDRQHGTHVAGTIGATFDNALGVDGVSPFANLIATDGVGVMSLSTHVDLILRSHPSMRVLNISLGFNWYQLGISPATNPVARLLADHYGSQFNDVLALIAAIPGRGLPVIVAAAGNDSRLGDEEARYGSPFTNAALSHNAAPVIVVEAVQNAAAPTRGIRAVFSNVGGHVSAPGVQITSTALSDGYMAMSGTSMAAPHVTGVVSFLYALDPTLPSPTMTTNPIRDLLIASGAVAVGTPAPLVDLFAAALDVDRIQGGDKVLRALVDVDDGTVDGNLRVAADGSIVTDPDADGNGTAGDGQVDMADFRRWRDWLLDAEESAARQLDGGATHSKRDLNGDGVVKDMSLEALFPRGDFNGDGEIHRTKPSRVPGVMAKRMVSDLEVLQEKFTDPDYAVSDLPGLINSGDISINPTQCLALPGAATVTSSVRIRGQQNPFDTRTHTTTASTQVYTVEANPGLYTARVDAFDASGATLLGSAEQDFDSGLGKDDHWDPVCRKIELSVVFPTSVAPGVATGLNIQASVRDPASAPAVPRAGISISILAAGGSVANDSGLTDAAGNFATTATLGGANQTLTLTVTASIPGGVSRTVIVHASPLAIPGPGGTYTGTWTLVDAFNNGQVNTRQYSVKFGRTPTIEIDYCFAVVGFGNGTCVGLPNSAEWRGQLNGNVFTSTRTLCESPLPCQDFTSTITVNFSGNQMTMSGVMRYGAISFTGTRP